jgi:hypothetical protein
MDDAPHAQPPLTPEERARLRAELEEMLAQSDREIEAGDHVDGKSFFAEMRQRIKEWARHRAADKRRSAR